MINISDVVRKIATSSEETITALRNGHLNLSAYAKTIRVNVEKETKKPVKVGSIVIALSRLQKTLGGTDPLIPHVYLYDISIKSSLVEIVFDKTNENLEKLKNFYMNKIFRSSDFLVVTHGLSEITIIASRDLHEDILQFFDREEPKAIINNLSAITARIDEKFINLPNTIYALLKCFATKRINIIELVSTYTELTLLFVQNDVHEAFTIMNNLLQK